MQAAHAPAAIGQSARLPLGHAGQTVDMDVAVRKLVVEDAPAVHSAILESIDHLRPWMPWAANEPTTLTERVEWISSVSESVGIFVGETFVGCAGLHDRISPTGREIGYWVRAGWTGRGIATAVVRLLVDQAFSSPGIDHLEIHHDKANVASSRVPERLGFTLVREVPDEIAAPGECGVSCEWLLRREQRGWEPVPASPGEAVAVDQ